MLISRGNALFALCCAATSLLTLLPATEASALPSPAIIGSAAAVYAPLSRWSKVGQERASVKTTAATPTATAAWTYAATAKGNYAVSVRAQTSANGYYALLVKSAPYTVSINGKQVGTAMVDQRTLRANWKDIGSYPLASGDKLTVTLGNNASGGTYVLADAIKVTPVPVAEGEGDIPLAFVIDNTDVRFSVPPSQTFSWFERQGPVYYGGTAKVSYTNVPVTASWNVDGLKSAKYAVFVTWFKSTGDGNIDYNMLRSFSHNARYQMVVDGGVVVDKVIDQTRMPSLVRDGANWEYLGTTDIATALKVQLMATDNNVVADAIRIEEITSSTAAICGNAVTEQSEDCDDGNSVYGDTCNNDCRFPVKEPGAARLRFFVEPVLSAGKTKEQVGLLLSKYVEDINGLYAKNTDRRFVFDKDKDWQDPTMSVYGSYDASWCITPSFHDEYWIVLKKSSSAPRTALFFGCVPGTNAQMMSIPMNEIWDRDDWMQYPSSINNPYNFALQSMVHELGHAHGLGMTEYYNSLKVKDDTSASPLMNLDFAWAGDPYWSVRSLILRDPMVGIVDTMRFSTMQFSPFSAESINREVHGDFAAQCPGEIPFVCNGIRNSHEVRISVVSDANSLPLSGCTASVFDEASQPVSTLTLDANGMGVFLWDARDPGNEGSGMRLIKVQCEEYESGAQWLSEYDVLAGDRMTGGGATGDFAYRSPLVFRMQPTLCGNGRIDTSEICDDGNRNGGDLCSNMCTWNSLCDGIAADQCLANRAYALLDVNRNAVLEFAEVRSRMRLFDQIVRGTLKYGDLNFDGKIDEWDIYLMSGTLNARQNIVADLNLDGLVDWRDQKFLQDFVRVSPTALPVTADIDFNNAINVADETILRSTIGQYLPKANEEYTNSQNPYDVNADGSVSPLDVLQVVNYINVHGTVQAPSDALVSGPNYYDVNGDDTVSPQDVLSIINYINAHP